jgi:hypothetical protein
VKRRITTIAACTAAVLALAAGQHASADTVSEANDRTWACMAVRHVIGTCLENPGESITDKGGVVGIVGDVLDPDE